MLLSVLFAAADHTYVRSNCSHVLKERAKVVLIGEEKVPVNAVYRENKGTVRIF